RSAELDATIAAIAAAVERSSGSQRLDLFVVYFPGLDIAQNALLGPSAGALSTSAMAARVDALRSYYPFLDCVLGPLIQFRESHSQMIVTQPGRVQASTGGLFATSSVFIERPPDAVDPTGSPLDVAPTILTTLGLPLSRELAGQP